MKKLLIFAIATLGMLACSSKNDPSNPTTSDVTIEGTLPGKFSVSNSTKVQFSKGNLQYQSSTNTWRFAEYQHDTTGIFWHDDNPSAWRASFGWGTGNNPTLSSLNENDYPTFVDWGVNKISNGGNQPNLWRTLTVNEWLYIFCYRVDAEKLFGLGSVRGTHGIILLPDDWTTPADVVFHSSKEDMIWKPYYYYDPYGGDNKEVVKEGDWGLWGNYEVPINAQDRDLFRKYSYNDSEWAKMEAAGAVLLPTYYMGYYWYAWSATDSTGSAVIDGIQYGPQYYPYYLWFVSTAIIPANNSENKSKHMAVRLVHDCQ